MQAYDPFATKATVAPSPAVAPVWLSAASEDSIRLAPLNLPPDTQRRIQALEKLSSEELGSYGSDTSKRMTALSESVTSRVTLANSGDFGDGIVQILKLTGTVDIKQLGQPSEKGLSGLIRKAKNAVTGVKVEVLAQFNSVSTEIDKICVELRKGVDRMKEESKWLASCYDENLNCLNELECNAEAVIVHLARQHGRAGRGVALVGHVVDLGTRGMREDAGRQMARRAVAGGAQGQALVLAAAMNCSSVLIWVLGLTAISMPCEANTMTGRRSPFLNGMLL